MPLDIASYTAAQRQRLEEIRRATEKERQLLALYAGNVSTNVHASSIANAIDDIPPHMATNDGGRWPMLNDKAMELHTLDTKLTEEERELERQRFELDRRLHAAERRKAELLSQLTLLQHRETLVKKQEEQLANMEADAEREARGLEAFAQEMGEEQQAVDTRVSEKRARLNAAKLSAKDQQKKRETLEARSRLQIEEIQDRIREHRVELMKRTSALNDKERWLRQEQSRLREAEMDAIYRLRKEIEFMEISLYGDSERH